MTAGPSQGPRVRAAAPPEGGGGDGGRAPGAPRTRAARRRARAVAWAAGLSLLASCAALRGRLEWRRPDGSEDPLALEQDVAECEELTRISRSSRGPFHAGSSARAYGGWGDFVFEFCMSRRSWTLTHVDGPAPG